MKLFYTPRTRSFRPRWMLEEMGLSYDLVRIDLRAGDQKREEYLNVNPFGAVPALEDGEFVISESAAICLHLTDKYGEKSKMVPALGSPQRARLYQWMFFGASTLDSTVVGIFLHSKIIPEERRNAKLVEANTLTYHRAIAPVLNNALRAKSYLLGEQFSAADVIVGSLLDLVERLDLNKDYPEISSYVQRMRARPAFQRAFID